MHDDAPELRKHNAAKITVRPERIQLGDAKPGTVGYVDSIDPDEGDLVIATDSGHVPAVSLWNGFGYTDDDEERDFFPLPDNATLHLSLGKGE